MANISIQPVGAKSAAFDPNAPFEVENAKPAPQFDPTQPFEAAPQVSTSEAAAEGVKKGLTFGFNDELTGASEAGRAGILPAEVNDKLRLGPMGHLVSAIGGGARMALEGLFGGDEATKAYTSGRDRVRALQAAAREQHPIASTVGEVGGAIATIPAVPGIALAKGAGLAARTVNSAATGAATAAAMGAGEGEGAADTVKRASIGGAAGLAGGAVAAPVMAAAGKGFDVLAKPFRGLTGADEEAAKRVFMAIAKDHPNATPDQIERIIANAAAKGEPLAVADLGTKGGNVHALARSASNTSPEANAALQNATGPRFLDQGERVADDIRWIVGGNPEAVAAREAIHKAAEASNKHNYAVAYQHPAAASMWDEGFRQLTTAPVVRDAIKKATTTGLNKAAADGFRPPRNPFNVADDGSLTMIPGVTPSLQFWDHVKRNLDDTISTLLRAGEKSAAADAQKLRSALVNHLDDLVPPFKQARSQAAAAFGADDALTAGEMFVTSRMENTEARRALAKMTAEQRKAFGYGFASEMMKEIREVVPANRSTVASKAFLNSPAAKERIEMALGPDGARRLEARVRLENMMENARAAVAGGSTTARQLVEAGLAGGFQGAGLGVGAGVLTGDANPWAVGGAAIVGALSKGAARQVDIKVARRVGELLASNDPQAVRKAAEMVARNPRLMDGVRRADSLVTRTFAVGQPDVAKLAPAASRADEQEPR